MPSLTEMIAAQRKEQENRGKSIQPGGAHPAQPIQFLAPAAVRDSGAAEVPAHTLAAAPIPSVTIPIAGLVINLSTTLKPITVNLTMAPKPAIQAPVAQIAKPLAAQPTPDLKLGMGDVLASLADMDVTKVAPLHGYSPPVSRAPTYVLPVDHQPAPKIDRDLPANLTEGQSAFVEQLDQVRNVFHDAELFSQIVKIIMQELQANPEFMELVGDSDVHYLVRGMREAMGIAKQVAATKKRASPSAAGKTKKATAAKDLGDIGDFAASLGMAFDD